VIEIKRIALEDAKNYREPPNWSKNDGYGTKKFKLVSFSIQTPTSYKVQPSLYTNNS